ncbi:synemin [Tiliqua scincoides]|uniref:synemin n=1 Tax=Tiliqua scincoides TaxID=71010 RepID=UPI003462052E
MEGCGDEEAELRELNARLRLYVSGVRSLERENGRLAAELAALRGRARPEPREQEVAELRLAVAELRRAAGAAELEREALRAELARLERLGAESLELRRRLRPALDEQRARLEGLRGDCAALEALRARLEAERRRLQEQRERRPPAKPCAAAPPPQEQSWALELRWSGGAESLARYEQELRALRELEGRLGRQDLQELRAQNQHSRRRLHELQRRCRELSAVAERLEAERRAQGERQGAQLARCQMIIEALTQEKEFLTVSIAEFLKDYHELLQVKAGLSLEIATYRALLEGESSQWILMWEEQHGRKLPQGVRNMLYEYCNHHSAYQREKGKQSVPAIQNIDIRYRKPVPSIGSSSIYSSRTKIDGTQVAAPWKTVRKDAPGPEYRPLAAIKKDVTLGRTVTDQKEFKSFTRPYVASQESNVQRRMLPERKGIEATSTASLVKESASVQKVVTTSNISGNLRTKVAVPTSFPSHSLNSGSKETNYERTIEETHTRANEEIKDSKPVKEQKSAFIDERERKDSFAKDVTNSGLEKLPKKPTGVESSVIFEKKIEIKRGTDERKPTMEEPMIKDNRKEGRFLGDKKDEKYGRWEERIRVDTSEKDFSADKKMEESHSFHKEQNVSTSTQSKEVFEIPIRSEVPIFGQTLENRNIEITLQDSKPGVKTKDELPAKLSRESYQTKESKEGRSKISNLLTESIAENIVSDILKGVVQKSSDAGPLPDSKITFEKKEVFEDGKTKTEVNIQSTVQEDLDACDEFDLVSFLKKDAKKVLEDSKGTLAEGIIKDIIGAGLEAGSDQRKKGVKVEIVEEPLGSTADVKVEFSTPFEVEEAEDTLPGVATHVYYGDEERATTSSAQDFKQKQPTVVVSHVEEVSEGDDVVDEEKYFVSTPDEQPLKHEQDESSVYGQIHIEEESTIKYSWQDEFLQGSQARMSEGMDSPEWTYHVMGEEAGGAFTSKGEMPKEQVARAESIVIEREIKIPHEFQESLKDIFSEETKDPKQQLKKALEKLEDTFPESVKQELSALTKEDQADSSSLEVDIKKVKHTEKEGLVTIVAEVNLSQTLDSDQFDTGYFGGGVTDEIKSPTQSPDIDGFDKYRKQESEIFSDHRNKVGEDVASTSWTAEDASWLPKLSGSDSVQYHTKEQVIHQGPVFQSVGPDSRADAFHSQESVDRSVRQIRISPTEIIRTEQVLYEHPVSETLEFRTGASADVSQSVKEFKLGPEGTETTEEIIYRGPVSKTVDVSGPEGPSHVQYSTDIRSTKHITLGPKQIIEEIAFEGSTSDKSSKDGSEALSQMQGPVETSRSIRHIRIHPQEVRTEQVIFEGPLSGFVEVSGAGEHIATKESVRHIRLGQKDTQITDQIIYEESPSWTAQPRHDPDRLFKEGTLDTNTTVRQIKLSPKESLTTTEQVVFAGPISEHLEFGESGTMFSSEGSVRRITLGQKEVLSSKHVVYQGSESSGISSAGEDILETEGPVEISRSFRHIRLSPVETHAEQIVFQGPVSETLRHGVADLSPTDGPSESNKSVGHIKIGPKETSFTFQMDVTSVAGGGQEATIVVPDRKGEAYQLEGQVTSGLKGTESEPRSEELTFDQTVQLQRLVDKRSVVSDEKKIALVYLNEEEEEEEEDGPWF